jgi:hypothetical protein
VLEYVGCLQTMSGRSGAACLPAMTDSTRLPSGRARHARRGRDRDGDARLANRDDDSAVRAGKLRRRCHDTRCVLRDTRQDPVRLGTLVPEESVD